MISDYDGEVSFKGTSTEYSYGHGSYRPYNRKYLFVAEASISMTITLKLRKIPCDQREFYVRMVKEELAKPGKLWAIENGTLLWADAVVENISPNFSRSKDKLEYNISFIIPGGVWTKADKRKTVLIPYDPCTLMDCKGYKKLNDCECCNCDHTVDIDCSCCCAGITENMALCHHEGDIADYYSCYTPYRVVYDCETAQRFAKNKYLGQRLCVSDICGDGVIAGRIYSETEIPTDDVTVILSGKMKNPWITINDNTNIIDGEYDGDLIIHPNGDVYYKTNDCCEGELLDPTVWSVPAGNEYGWTIEPGYNSVIVHLNECCVGATCIYLQHEAIAL